MKKIDSAYDNVIEANYDLFSVKLSDLKSLAKSWYKDINLEKFDSRNRYKTNLQDDEGKLVEMKKSGLICNLFFAYLEDDKYYLLDGFNRLLTDYGAITDDTIVYLKVITDKLADNKLTHIMYRLNMWKLSNNTRSYGGFNVNLFFDRGFKLLLHTKFDIQFYDYNDVDGNYHNRTRYDSDLEIVDQYFVSESEMSAEFKTSYVGVNMLMSHENIINDIKSIIKGNDYLNPPFKNYGMFLEGYARYLAYLRYKKITKVYQFEEFLEMLYKDKTFFKKLQGMSGTDSTRKNIYHFYRNLNLHMSI